MKPISFVCSLGVFTIALLSGCAESGQGEGVFGGGAGAAVGGGVVRAAGMSTGEARVSGAAVGAASARAAAIIAKYQATAKQRQVAVARAQRVYQQMSPQKKSSLRQKKVRYIAVDTVRDERAKGEESIMLWDTQTKDVVGNEVYDVAERPATGATLSFETYAAEYVGRGA
jgi:hypothetical protein